MRLSYNFDRYALKVVSLFFCALLVFVMFSSSVFADDTKAPSETDFEGSGSQYDPYLINSYEDLCLLRDLVDKGNSFNGKYLVQTEDITIPEGEIWGGIGSYRSNTAFNGIYNGKGHSIFNLICDEKYSGLFSYLSGQIWNLGIESGCISGDFAGSICSQCSVTAKIVNCYNRAEVRGVSRAGGITENNCGVIMFCLNLGNIYGESADTVTCGISSSGEGPIRYCYTITDRLVDGPLYNGSIFDSYTSQDISIQEFIEFYYEMMWTVYFNQKYSEYSFENSSSMAAVRFGELEVEDDTNYVFKSWSDIYITSYVDLYDGVYINRDNIVFMVGNDIRFDCDYEPVLFVAEKENSKNSYVDIFNRRFDFEGRGTENDPFRINSYEDLCLLRDCVNINVSYNDYYFVLTEDIYIEDDNWIPIGLPNLERGFTSVNDKGNSFTGFYGYLDGQGHSIYDLNCESMFAGLFGALYGRITNLGIESGVIKGDFAGSITCYSGPDAEIINCYNKASVYGNYRAGGICDYYRGKIVYCWNMGEVVGTAYHTTVASICSFGPAKIIDSFAVGNLQLISNDTFTGSLEGSGVVDSYQVEDYEDFNDLISNGVIDDITIYKFSDGNSISFSSDILVSNTNALMYLPHMFLLGFAIFGGVFLIILNSRKKINRTKTKDNSTSEIPSHISSNLLFKRIGCTILTLVLLTIELYIVTATLQNKNTTGVTNMQDYYYQKDVDVIFVGSSRSGINFDGEVLWNEYGLNTYNLWASGAPMWNSYYFIKEAIEVNRPKMVVLETNALTYGEMEYTDDYYLIKNSIAIENIFNRFESTIVSTEKEKILDYMLKLPLFHERIFEISQNDFEHYYWNEELSEEKGYKANDLSEINKWDLGEDVVKYYAIPEKQLFYLEATIDLCKNNDIPIILVKTQIDNYAFQKPLYNTLSLVAEEHGIKFIDYNLLKDEMNFDVNDFGDGHLNTWGARKNSEYIGKYIIENYPELVGGDDSLWDVSAAKLQDTLISSIADNDDYFNELARDNKKVIVINYRCENEDSTDYLTFEEQLNVIDYSEIEDFKIGEDDESIIDLNLGSHCITITPEHDEMMFEIDHEDFVSVNSRCIVVIVFDEVSDDIADISCFSASDHFVIKHIYPI